MDSIADVYTSSHIVSEPTAFIEVGRVEFAALGSYQPLDRAQTPLPLFGLSGSVVVSTRTIGPSLHAYSRELGAFMKFDIRLVRETVTFLEADSGLDWDNVDLPDLLLSFQELSGFGVNYSRPLEAQERFQRRVTHIKDVLEKLQIGVIVDDAAGITEAVFVMGSTRL